MTRTKRPRKTSTLKKELSRNVLSCNSEFTSTGQQSDDLKILLSKSYASNDHFKKAFELFYEAKLQAHKKRYESACEYVKSSLKEKIDTLPETYLNLKIHSYHDEDLLNTGNQECDASIPKTRPSRTRKADSTTFEFKRPKTPRVERSLPRNRSSSRKRSVSAPPPMATPLSDRFKTPSQSLQRLCPMSVITPKLSETPMCVLRRPERGEVVFAATGSPLLVGRVSLEDVPTVSVPLQDGRIFSILPDPGAAPPCLPEFDEETRRYLKTLRKHLEMLAPSSP